MKTTYRSDYACLSCDLGEAWLKRALSCISGRKDTEIEIFIWGLTIRNIANNLGYEIEGFKTSFEKRVTDKPIPVGWGTIEPGKVSAVWVRTAGIVNGREAIVIEHINRMSQDTAKDWPYTDRVGQISVRIDGDPNLQVDINVSKPEQPEELSYEGYVLTAMRIVNAIPQVCAAKPGIVTIFMDTVIKMHMMLIPVGEVAREFGKEYTVSFEGFKAADGSVFKPQSMKFKTLPRKQKDPRYAAHDAVALRAAVEGMVLLKNEGGGKYVKILKKAVRDGKLPVENLRDNAKYVIALVLNAKKREAGK